MDYLLIISVIILALSVYFYIMAGSRYLEYKKIKERFDPRKQMPNIEVDRYKRQEVKVTATMPDHMVVNVEHKQIFDNVKLRYSKQFMEAYANLCGYEIDLKKLDEHRTFVTVTFGVFTKS